MNADPRWDEARRRGEDNAKLLLAERARLARELERESERVRGARLGLAPQGLLVAEGDSWFAYPFFDVLEALEKVYRWDVESVARAGDTLEGMAYDWRQLSKLDRRLEKLDARGLKPDALLLSAGGNDVAGPALAAVLNHRGAPEPGPSPAMLDALFGERLRLAMVTLVSMMTAVYKSRFGSQPRILVHGYDYPVPDGRGYLGGFWLLPGPWLEPRFRARGYEEIEESARHMRLLIDRFNDAVRTVADGFANVQYVDLRGALSSRIEGGVYKDSWDNELHPTVEGFRALAARFHEALGT